MLNELQVGLFVAVAFVLLYLYLTRNHGYWRKRGIKGDKPVAIFGNLFSAFFGKIQVGLIHNNTYRKYPGEKVVGWFKLGQPALLLRDPELIRRVFVQDFHNFRNNDAELDPEVDPILGRNLFVLKDDLWKKNRALLTPAFTAGKIKGIYPMMTEVAREFVSYLKKHPEEVNVKDILSRYTAEVTARCGLGIQGNNFKDPVSEMHEMGKVVFQTDAVNNFKFILFVVAPYLVRLLKLQFVPKKVAKFFDGVLRDVIEYRQENKVERTDFVQFLLDVKKKSLQVANGEIESETHTQVYSNEDVLAGCVMFFIESFETTALSLTNVLYFLARNKDVQDRLRKEIDAAFDEGDISFEKIHELPYMNAVVLESSRILPAMYTFQKVCTDRYEMDVGKSEPLVVEKGTPVYVPIYAIHNDPIYWDEPERFNPERFAGKEDAEARAKGIFLPFGDGPRMCPGMRIATTILKLGLAYIVANLEVLTTSKTPDKINHDPNYIMLSHKGGIHLRFAERSF